MISLYDSCITDILPANIKNSPEVQAISYALQKQNRKILKYLKNINVIYAIDNIPIEIVDLMASELRTQYYSDELSDEVKRELVKNTLIWYMRAGTTSAVKELVSILFKNGSVEEWFEYGGEPYHFKIEVNTVLDQENIAKFNDIIKRVKNTRSQMDGFNKINDFGSTNELGPIYYFGSKIIKTKHIRIGG